ncbi:MAG TPA: phosphatidylserine decarboxylase [Acidobacteriota bacterium]|nr:phosphatidylserine decarboxylase [Acidobacteriota bacterium]
MAKDAWYFIVPLLLLAAAAGYLGWLITAGILIFLAGFVAFFFRDPERTVPSDKQAVVSPADGKVIRIKDQPDGSKLLSIFLSIFDVHVNRAPIEGAIVRQEYRPGKFFIASDDRASVENEQLVITIRGEWELSFALIAGIVARRIVPWKKAGDAVSKGDRIALIRFGSRVDILLPANCDLLAKQGDRVYAGRSIIGRWRER